MVPDPEKHVAESSRLKHQARNSGTHDARGLMFNGEGCDWSNVVTFDYAEVGCKLTRVYNAPVVAE